MICEIVLFFFLLAVVKLADAVVDPWMRAAQYGRVDFSEIGFSSDFGLSAARACSGGWAEPSSHWNRYDVNTRAGTEMLKHHLLEKEHELCGCHVRARQRS